ncbi:AaceriADR232Wp [[Ashbya] aceris (nom. inval.)]|nr:AaceriADR232Wp [[Ashbya] aceris (nom. inval.)]
MSPYNVLNTTLNSSPFPQLKPHVRYRTAMERAGFDVAYGKFGGRPASKTSAASVAGSRTGKGHAAHVGGVHSSSTSSLPAGQPIEQDKTSGSADRTLPAAEGLGISASMPSLNTELAAGPEVDAAPAVEAFALPEIQVSYNHDQRSLATAERMPSFVVPTPRNSLHSDTDRGSEYSSISEQATLPPYDAGTDTGRFSQHFSPAAKRTSAADLGSVSTETRSFASSAQRLSMYGETDAVSAPFQLMPTPAAPSVQPVDSATSLPVSLDAHAKDHSIYSSATSDDHLGTHSTLDVDQKTTREPSIFDFENQKNSVAISQSNASSTYPTSAPGSAQEPVFPALDPVERSFMMLTQNSQPNMEDKVEEERQSLYSTDDFQHSVNTTRTTNSYQSASAGSYASSRRSQGVAADRRQTRYSMMPKIQVTNSATSLVSIVDDGIDIAPDPILQGPLGKKAEDVSPGLSSDGSSEDEITVAATPQPSGLSSTTSQVERLIAQLDDVSLNRGDVDSFDSTTVPLPTSSLAATSHLSQASLSNRAKKSSAYLSGIPDDVRNLPDLSIDPTLTTMTEHSSPESNILSPDAQSPVMLSFKGRSLDEIWNPTKPAERLSVVAKRQSVAARNTANRPVSTYGPNTIQPSQLTHVLSLEAAQRPREPAPPAAEPTPPLSPADSPTAWSLLDADSEIHTSPLRISAATPKYPPGKGPCRSCGEKIKTKSIYSKREGELSGQWHRECFRCTVCALKFNKHVPCYILDDVIYCRQHYHEANNSICRVCRDFIEGECLENDKGETFHVSCLTCYLCRRLIQEDYYIYNDELPLCANHDMDALVRNGIHGDRRSAGPDSLDVTNTLSKRRTRLINV